MSQEFRLENINETRNYLLKEIKQTKLMSRKLKNVCATLSCIEQFFYFSFYNYMTYFNFCFGFFAWYSYRNY